MKKYFTLFPFLFCFIVFLPLNGQDVVINEIMSKNNDVLADQDGDFSDWIELYNNSETTIQLENWMLSDKEDDLAKWIFPALEIPAKGFLLIFASDKDRTNIEELHTNFKISAEGEALFLSDPNGEIQDQFPDTEIPENSSLGRETDGAPDLAIFSIPSPEASNNEESIIPTEELFFSHDSGWYQAAIELNVESAAAHQIYYTTDGTNPSPNSQKYESNISIQSLADQENNISLISTSPEFWSAPKNKIFKVNILRFASFNDNKRTSPVYSKTYLIDPEGSARYPFPIVSLIVEPDHLFDSDLGILVDGRDEDEEEGEEGIPNYNQRGKLWEKAAHLEYFDSNGTSILDQEMGIRIHGDFSRKLPQKSLRLYARSEYGDSNFEHSFFEQKPELNQFKRLILRTSNPNYFHLPFKDELAHLLMKEMGMDYQAFTPVIAFINGSYWGIFNLKERQDEHYLTGNKSIPEEEIHLFEKEGELIFGEQRTFDELKNFVEDSNFENESDYTALSELIDVNNFVKFLVAQAYFELWDFPEQNLKFWKSDEGKWQWLFNDGDSAINDYWKSKLLEILFPEGTAADGLFFTTLVQKLMTNKSFKRKFYGEMLYQLNNTFSPKNIITKIDSLDAIYGPQMPEHIARWNYPENINNYHAAVAHVKRFAALRPATLIRDLNELFDVPVTVFPNPTADLLHLDFFDESVSSPVRYKIYDLLGREMSAGTLVDNTISLSSFSRGIYLLQVEIETVYFTLKVVKE